MSLAEPKKKRHICINILCAKNTQDKEQSVAVSSQWQGCNSPRFTSNFQGIYLRWIFAVCMGKWIITTFVCERLIHGWRISLEDEVINISNLGSWRNLGAIKVLAAKTMCNGKKLLGYPIGSLLKVYQDPLEARANCGWGCWKQHWGECTGKTHSNKIRTGCCLDEGSYFGNSGVESWTTGHSIEDAVTHCDMPTLFPSLRTQ